MDIFCGGLGYDYLKMKLLRAATDKLEQVVEICMHNQNIQMQFELESEEDKPAVEQNAHPRIMKNFRVIQKEQITSGSFPGIKLGNLPAIIVGWSINRVEFRRGHEHYVTCATLSLWK